MWFDEWGIQPGDDIYLAIERGLEASRALVLCLSLTALGCIWAWFLASAIHLKPIGHSPPATSCLDCGKTAHPLPPACCLPAPR